MIGSRDRVRDDGTFHKRKFVGQCDHILGGREHVLGIAAVCVVAEHDHFLANVFASRAAHGALTASIHGGEQDARALLPLRDARAQARDLARDFMPQHERRLFERGNVVVNVMQVGMADSASRHFDEDFARRRSGRGNFFDRQRLMRGVKYSGFHECFSNALRKDSGTRIFFNVLRSAVTTVISPFAVRRFSLVSLKISKSKRALDPPTLPARQ